MIRRPPRSTPFPTRRSSDLLFVDLFLDAHTKAPAQITLDLDATDDPLHGEQEGRFFHRSEEHTSELQSPCNLVCRLLLEKKKKSTSLHSESTTNLSTITTSV